MRKDDACCKMPSDFDPALKARLDRAPAGSVIALTSHLRAPQAPVLAGDTALDGIIHVATAATKVPGMAGSRLARLLGVAAAGVTLE